MSNEVLLVIVICLFFITVYGGLYFAFKEEKPLKKHG